MLLLSSPCQIGSTHALGQAADILLQSIVVSFQLLVAAFYVFDFFDKGGKAGLVFECGTIERRVKVEKYQYLMVILFFLSSFSE